MQHLNGLKYIAQHAPEQLTLLGSKSTLHTRSGTHPAVISYPRFDEDSLQPGIMRAYAAMLPFVLQKTPLSTTLLSVIHTQIYRDSSYVLYDNLGQFRGFGKWSGNLFSTYKLYQTVVSQAGMYELLEAQKRDLCYCETAYQKPLHSITEIKEQLVSPTGYFCVSGYRAGFSWFDLNALQDKIEQQQRMFSSDGQCLSNFTQEEQNTLELEIQSIFQRWRIHFNEILINLFALFEQNISQSTQQEHAILREIAKFIKDLLYVHPFFEGNLRCIGIVFCNTLLMRYGFYPAIIEDPFAWRGFSADEMVEKLQKGMQSFYARVVHVKQNESIQHLSTTSTYSQQLVEPFQSALLGLKIPEVNALE